MGIFDFLFGKEEEEKGAQLQENLNELTVKELREIARDNDLSGYSRLRKKELIDFLYEELL